MLQEKLKYGIKRTVPYSFETAVEKITNALKNEGFGILTEIDVKATFKKKLDKDFRPYVILGACNPPLAHHALSEEIDIGLLLPCNVVIYEDDMSDGTIVSVIDPEIMVRVMERDDMDDFASEVKAKLTKALSAI